MHDDLRTRFLVAIIIGCDVYDGGCNRTGPSKLFNHIESSGNVASDLNNILTEHIAKN